MKKDSLLSYNLEIREMIKDLINHITILASFIGITDKTEIDKFVNRKLEETGNLANKIFTGVVEPIDTETQEVVDNEFKF